jgi:hypothetical protein
VKRKVSAYLTPLKRAPKRKRFGTFDLESKDGPSQKAGFTRPFMAGYYDGKQYHSFFDSVPISRRPKEFVERTWREAHLERNRGCIDKLCRMMFTEKTDGMVFYAHNGGSFDHLFLLAWLARKRKEGFSFVVVPVQSTIQAVKISKKVGKKKLSWTLLDSMRLLPMGLEKAGKAFGLGSKEEMDLEAHELDLRWKGYNAKDVILLYQVIERVHDLVENVLGGEVGITAPATSMKIFRRKYLKKPIPRHAHFPDCKSTECEGCFHEWVRQSYHGGRTELFELEGHDVRYFDINASYVAALCELMPVGLRMMEIGSIDWKLSVTHGGEWIGFAECTVRIPETCQVPPLPYKREEGGKLLFPTGTFKGVWDVSELALLFDSHVNGEILEVGRVVWIKGELSHKEMMLALFRLRDKTQPDYSEGLDALGKLFGNGHYGKYAMDPEKEQIAFARERDKNEKGEVTCLLCTHAASPDSIFCSECEGSKAAGDDPEAEVWYQRRRVDAPYIIPQIASHVTALARIKLWQYNIMATDKGGKLFMNDTDSIVTNVDLPTGKGLGQLKDEYPRIEGDPLHFVGLQPKAYLLERNHPFPGEHRKDCKDKKACKGCLGVKVTFKGIPKGQRTKENFVHLQAGGTVYYTRLEKVRSLARAAFSRPPKMIDVKRRLVGKYDKRRVLADGKSTVPLVLTLEDEVANDVMSHAAEE